MDQSQKEQMEASYSANNLILSAYSRFMKKELEKTIQADEKLVLNSDPEIMNTLLYNRGYRAACRKIIEMLPEGEK